MARYAESGFITTDVDSQNTAMIALAEETRRAWLHGYLDNSAAPMHDLSQVEVVKRFVPRFLTCTLNV